MECMIPPLFRLNTRRQTHADSCLMLAIILGVQLIASVLYFLFKNNL